MFTPFSETGWGFSFYTPLNFSKFTFKSFRTLTAKRPGKRFLKITGIIVGSLLVLLTAFHFWVVHHAEEIIQDLVASKSNGKIKLEVRNFKFNWFSKKMELEDAVFYTTDSVTAATSYRFAIKKVKLKVTSVFPVIFEKKILINNLSLIDPDITVTRMRPSKDSARGDKSSIPQEMGRIYKSIQDAIHVLKVRKFEIENARFTLVNRMRPDQLPVSIGRIDFHIDNLNIEDSNSASKEKIFFSDNIVLKSRDQDILFPDRRHRLSYRKFRINLEKKIVEFDSCTIAALKTDSTSTGFSIFFDELQMTNIDFDTLYRAEVIKADSVYCINPQFKLQVDLDKRKKDKKQSPSIEQVIRQLTGDLSLNFVVVNNAAFDINILRGGNPSSFTSSGNNFEMQGLSIDNDAGRPLRVKKFGMGIRNYENFLRDSLYALQFDSILVKDDRIYLNNFSFQQLLGNKTVNSFNVPRFQLTGLSWNDLLFEQKLSARQATLFNPVINYTEAPRKNRPGKDRIIFEALADINQVIKLDDLSIVNGTINMKLNGGVEMKLKDATLSVESRSLLGSNQLSGIRRSVNYLNFSKGDFKINDFTVQLTDVNYRGAESRFKAAAVNIINDSRQIAAAASGVTMNEIFINENTGDVSVGGMHWEQADINIAALTSRTKKGASFINLTDISGRNTQLHLPIGNKKAAAWIDHLSASAFLLKPGEKPIIADLTLSGKNLAIEDAALQLHADSFVVDDEKKALFTNVSYRNITATGSTVITIPSLSFVPYIQQFIYAQLRADELVITKPVISIHSKNDEAAVSSRFSLPAGTINRIFLDQPLVSFSRQDGRDSMVLQWNGSAGKSNTVVLLDVTTGGTSLDVKELYASLNNFIFKNSNGRSFNAGKGEVTALLQNIHFKKPEGEPASWQATLALLDGKNFFIDSMGKKSGNLAIKTVQLKDLTIRSSSIRSVRKLVEENQGFRIQQLTGGYADKTNRFTWLNAAYDKSNKLFTADSFSYSPSPSRDEFVAAHPYQEDYIVIRTGPLRVGPFDIDTYLRDTIVQIGVVKIDKLDFDDYRDNRKPFKAGVVKPLMGERIKNIPFKLSIDSILLNDVNVKYAEVNPKTGQTGVIPLTRMTFKAFPVKNFGLAEKDSLRIHANGYLMDSVWIRLRLKEAYNDSLEGFLMTVRIKPADMRILNTVLGPLAGAKLKSGYLDTMSMRVAGNDYMAVGEMELLYHDLKIQLFKKADTLGNRKPDGLLNFLANSFVVKNKNNKKKHSVFYIRNRDRSSINYLIKMVLNGASNTIGIKNNRKVLRRYKKELRQRNLPPFDYD